MSQPPKVKLPHRIEIIHTGYSLEIRRKWFTPDILFLTVFIVFWDYSLYIWIREALEMGNTIAVMFPVFHVLVGLALTIHVLKGWLNKTHITVEAAKILIRTFPIALRPIRTMESWTIQQLVVKRSRMSFFPFGSGSHQIQALLTSKKRVNLVKGLKLSQARYIEREIEKYLGLADRDVKE